MVIVKLIILITVVVLLAKGFASDETKARIEVEAKLKNVQDASKEAYSLFLSERRLFTNTIDELREEVQELQTRNELLRGGK